MPRKNLNILVAGGFDPKDQGALDKPVADFIAFGQCLGAEIIQQGHNLITGCQTELDSIVAAAAQQQLKQMNKPIPKNSASSVTSCRGRLPATR